MSFETESCEAKKPLILDLNTTVGEILILCHKFQNFSRTRTLSWTLWFGS